MNKLIIWLVPLFFIVSGCNRVPKEEFDFASYKPASFAEINEEQKDQLLAKNLATDYTYDVRPSKYKINCLFSKELREISPAKLQFIQKWGKTVGAAGDFIELFKHEFQIKQDEKEYWIPVQEPLLPVMAKELRIGQNFNVYVVLPGAMKTEFVFLATEFEAIEKGE